MWFEKDLKVVENTPALETERLILRRFTQRDDESMLRILRDEEANTFLPWFPVKTLLGARVHLQKRYLNAYSRPWGYQYAVCLKSDNRPIGYLGLTEDESLDFGYGLLKEFWGRGIATEAARAVAGRIQAAGFPYITATHDVLNPASGAVMKKLGMTYRYSYEEQWQPKNILVTFRLYQLDFADPPCPTFSLYREKYPHFVEKL